MLLTKQSYEHVLRDYFLSIAYFIGLKSFA